MPHSYIASWGNPAYGTVKVQVRDLPGMARAYDLAAADARIVGTVFEVDVWDTALPPTGLTGLRFLVGHARRARVLVHHDGVGRCAVGEIPVAADGGLSYERPDGASSAAPETVTLTPAGAREVVLDLVRTGRPSDDITWSAFSLG
ncbi:hypothetical protein [Promicromonospora sukumoe]|uniref:hypothetical protein n=1 Tax=Promicromonospora sukumoe TaxID=88382 RepID=UPI0036675096